MTKSFTETAHPAEFILTEEDGHLSRDNVTIAADQDVKVGSIIMGGGSGWSAAPIGAAPTEGIGIAIYAAKTEAGETVGISAITRLAEVNGKCLAWPDGATQADMEALAAALAKANIIVRGYPDQSTASPSP